MTLTNAPLSSLLLSLTDMLREAARRMSSMAAHLADWADRIHSAQDHPLVDGFLDKTLRDLLDWLLRIASSRLQGITRLVTDLLTQRLGAGCIAGLG